ncbi:MAG: hypothetical protein SFY80_01765 [Verrucomicrobiota bacterium]|nr:hypothetical protein [Verrucomicrobiota bacterium]
MPMEILRKYTLADVDSRNPAAVAAHVTKLYNDVFPGRDTGFVSCWFDHVERMFSGNYKDFQKIDTVYHDLEHTMQATLCFVRIFCNRQLLGIQPQMTARDFEIGLVGILMHDVGYLKEKEDTDGTGAKFTFVHELRSCEMAAICLEEAGWKKQDVFQVQHLISCTGPRATIDAIPFRNPLEKILGLGVCTADYLGQMSDPGYVDKLPPLFKEFEESDNYRNIPLEKRLFKSADEMLKKTPGFWKHIVLPKLENECQGLYRYLAVPYPDGPNPYIAAVEENIERIQNGRYAVMA